MLDQILNNQNMNEARKKVRANKGSAGVDGVTIEDLDTYVQENWLDIRKQIKARKYKPKPVKRVEIPKPNGGVRMLGIPTVMDRVIQQAIVQVLTPICEPQFSEFSYGFRPGRNGQMAITQLLQNINEGYQWIVDIDLEKFFDKVPQNRLMSLVHNMIDDGDTESLIRKYLRAGVMITNRYEPTDVGTPQGGNLSPLLSNIMLNELDKELEERGLNFVRYADDCIIMVKSRAAANRVMKSITKWLEKKLGLKVNAEKSKITRPSKLKYLGFGLYYNNKHKAWMSRPHEDSVLKFKRKLKKLTRRNWSINFRERVKKINEVTRGWINYFSMSSMKKKMKEIDGHLRTRLRVVIWKMWKVASRRQWGLQKLGIKKDWARATAYLGARYQLVATKTCAKLAISKKRLTQSGLVSCLDYYIEKHSLYS
jgi:group II intron reverse transcriptase/maturase